MMTIGWRLWCFSEQRMYSAYDTYKIFKKNVDTHELAIMILKKFPPEVQEKIIKDAGQELELDELPFESWLQRFKEHNINYSELITNIVNVLEKGED